MLCHMIGCREFLLCAVFITHFCLHYYTKYHGKFDTNYIIFQKPWSFFLKEKFKEIFFVKEIEKLLDYPGISIFQNEILKIK
jgi:hypothetical protein